MLNLGDFWLTGSFIAGDPCTALDSPDALVITEELTGLVAGSFPAFVLSAFDPVYCLRSGFSSEWSIKSLQNSLQVGGDIGVFRQAHSPLTLSILT